MQKFSGPTPEFEMARTAVGRISIDPKIKQEVLAASNLAELYQQAGTNRKQGQQGSRGSTAAAASRSSLAAAAAAGSAAAALQAAAGQLTYQRLAAIAPMQKATTVVVQQLLRYMELFYKRSNGRQQHAFEVAVLLDNSGSMSRLADEMKQALVLLAEVLRRLEVKFAVVRFGRAHGQVVLKGLQEPFSAQALQLALEAMTFDEGTYSASACEFVAREVFKDAGSANLSSGSSQAPVPAAAAAAAGLGAEDGADTVHHRLVLALVDGLTQEMRAEDYLGALQPKGIKLAVLNLYDRQQEEMMGRINDLWAAAADHAETLSKEHAADLSKVVAKLITSYLDSELQLAAATAAAAPSAPSSTGATSAAGNSSSGSVPPAASTLPAPAALQAPTVSSQPFLLPVLSKGLAALGAVSYDAASLQGGVEPASMFRHSPAGARIPFAAALAAGDAAGNVASSSSSSSNSASLQLQIEDAQARLSEFCSGIRQSQMHAAALQQVAELWQRALTRPAVQGQVNRLVEVLEGAVLPHNKHTRRRAEESGTSLHLPGLIRAASSNYSSHKIFARKTAGGKRTYQVALLLDVSQSMHGHLQQCSLEVLAMMADALGKLGLDDFLVVTFGAAPVLVKGPDTAWDQASQLALLEQVNCKPDQHLASMDAAAIQTSTTLLSSSNSRASKKIFVISDGYGTSGLALAAALQQAGQAGVEVVGLSVGFDRSHVPVCYQRWATAALPSALPDALQALYTADDMAAASSSNGAAAAAAAGEDWTELMPVMSGAAATVEEVLQQQSSVFGDLVRQLSQHKEAKLIHAQPDDMSVDICFCIDVTGSMSGWIEACKAQIQAIADGLMPKIQEKCKDIAVRVRWGVVAYRDVGDVEQLQELPFTEDTKELVAMVKKLQAQGGGDEPEDMMAALSAAAQLQWQAKARFLVLIADSPAHGRDCNDDPKDTHPSGSPQPGCDVQSVMQELRKQSVDLMVMPVKALKLDKTAAAMRRHYDCPAEDRKLSCEPLFDSSKQPAHAFHFVFCLDASGSMCGQPWQQLVAAYQQLLSRRTSDQCASDSVSVVTFNDSPTIAIRQQPLTSAPRSFYGGSGGTCFTPALNACDGLLAATPTGLTPILVFMSDGCDGGSSPVAAMQQLHAKYSSRNLQVHTIAFGHSYGSGATLLQSMAAAAGGQFHAAAGGLQLSQVFVQIAAECTAVDGLVKRFSEILSDMITVKVMVDYL